MKLLKRIIAVITLSVCFTVLVGCGASVDYYYSSDGDTIYYSYVVTMSGNLMKTLEKSAAIRTGDNKWTLAGYFAVLGSGFGTEVKHTGASGYTGDHYFTFSGSREVPDDDEDDNTDEQEEPQYVLEKGFFRTRVIWTQDSPFEGVYGQFIGEEETTEGSLIDVLKNGYNGIPAFTEAFPAAKELDPTELTLRFLWNNNRVTPENGETEYINGKYYSVWTVSFDSEKKEIIYWYYVPNPVGWYVVILGVGLLIVGLIVLITLKSKKEPKFVEARTGPVRYRNAATGSNVYYSEFNNSRKKAAEDARRELDELFGTENNAGNDLDDIFGLTDDKPKSDRNTDYIYDGEDDEDKK